jgi:uncharacterized damage-inducible protein DinB
MDTIAEYYRGRHALVLKLVRPLDDQQLLWRPNETTPSIAFHVWHLARWADYLQEMIAGTGVQIWEMDGLAAQWGFDRANLGFAETGLGMADEVLSFLPFPRKQALLEYAERAFTEADRAIGGVSDGQFRRRVQDRHGAEWKEMPAGEAILNWLVHDSRHLGMMECLLGAQGQHGSATR